MKVKEFMIYLNEDQSPYLTAKNSDVEIDGRETYCMPQQFYQMALQSDMHKHGFESAYAVFMNQKNKILGMSEISRGSLTNSIVPIREVIQTAMLSGAIHIILMHNHPSGDCTPGEQDMVVTKRLKEALDLCGLYLTDHIVVTRNGYFSFLEHAFL